MTLVDTTVAATATGRNERTIRKAVAMGLLTNYGSRRRVRVDLWAARDLFPERAHAA